MKNIILIILTILITEISCQKSYPPDPPAAIFKYMSLTPGSIWNYELTDNRLAAASLFTITSTGKDSSINGRSYHVFTNSSGSANEYYNITGNDYYNFRSLPSALGGANVENIYLKDNAAVGSNWSQSYPITVSGFALNATLTNTITEKGISKTVKGISYNDVIHVTTTVAVTVSGIPLPSGALTTDIQTYYAGKFGMVQSINIINLNFSGITDSTNQQTNLVSANIK